MNIAYHSGAIVQRIKNGVFDHQRVVVPGGLIYENKPDTGEGLYPLDDFMASAKDKLSVILPDWQDRLSILANIEKELKSPRKYSLLSNNCQDTVSRVVSGRARSHQREAVFAAAAMTITLIAIAKLSNQ